MKYYLDTEFDGAGGPLISLALIAEDGRSVYCVTEHEPSDPWVLANVCPVVLAVPEAAILCPSGAVGAVVAHFLRPDKAPVIVSDWLADTAHLCRELTSRSLYWSDPDGDLRGMPPLRFECSNVDAYPTTLPGAIQHNAWWDAMALRHLLEGIASTPDDAREASKPKARATELNPSISDVKPPVVGEGDHIPDASKKVSPREAGLREALEKIERWEMPETGKCWVNADGSQSDRPMSYSACYGSNGERDHIRKIARRALSSGDRP